MVDSDLKGDGVSFLSIQVLQHGGDQDGCGEGPHSCDCIIHPLTLIIIPSEVCHLKQS